MTAYRLQQVQMAFHKDRQYCGKCGLTYQFQPGTKPPVV